MEKNNKIHDEQSLARVSQTVFTQQPQTTAIVTQPKERQWTTGICDCCADCSICCCAICCGMCLNCALAKKLEEHWCVGCCGSAGLIAMRTKYRAKHGIYGSMMEDICCSCWCGMCAQCQLARDMKSEMYPYTCCGCC